MSVQLAIANIALGTATVSRLGFGTALFVGKHNYFSERIRSYTSTQSMTDDGIPTTANIFIAAQGAFSQTPHPVILKIGRQETTSVLALSNFVASTSTHTVTLEANGIAQATIAVPANTTEELTIDDIKTAIDAVFTTKITVTKVGVAAAAVLNLVQTVSGTDWYVVSGLINLTESFIALSTEAAADTIAAIEAEDGQYYYFTAEDKSSTFVLAAAADLEARLKMYFVSVDEATSLISTPTGILADLQTGNYFRTHGIFHQNATTTFPELAQISEIAPFVTGAVTYANRIVAAVSPSQNALGNDITTTEQLNLAKVNAGFFARAGGFSTDPVITQGGKVASGEWIDAVVGRDNMQVDIEADFTNLLIQQKASKVAFNNKGANQFRSVLSTTLGLYTPEGIHNYIEDDFEIIIPDQTLFNPADKATRIFKQITFKATLTNAIHMVELTGTLSL